MKTTNPPFYLEGLSHWAGFISVFFLRGKNGEKGNKKNKKKRFMAGAGRS